MSGNLTAGQLTAQPCEKVTGINQFPVDGKTFSLPMYLINGVDPGPTLVITGGVHAAEYASIAAALELGQALDQSEIKGQVIVVPVLNQAGFKVRSIYLNPMDNINLNRVFPGKSDGGASEQIANWVFENVMKQANYYIDLHGGDLVEALVPFTLFPEVGQAEVDRASVELAEAFGVEYLVRKVGSSGSTFSAVAAAGIPSILVESGGQGIWPRPDVVRLTEGVFRVMRYAGMLDGGQPEKVSTIVLKDFIWLRSDYDGFWYPAIEVGQNVSRGQVLGVVKDVWGKVLQTAQASADGRILFLVSSLAINQGDPLLSIGA
jgi:predicted deacylase